MYFDFFHKFIDTKKYQLSVKNIMLIEEFVQNASQHCVEGWTDQNGKNYLWATSDSNYYEDG